MEYVRTKTGRIYKLSYYNKEEERWICVTDEDWFPVYESEIVKRSKNVIDLIEECDYVNGKKIDAIFDSGFKIQGVAERVLCFETDFPIEKGIRVYHNYDIKSIVTKEQFASMEYKVKE